MCKKTGLNLCTQTMILVEVFCHIICSQGCPTMQDAEDRNAHKYFNLTLNSFKSSSGHTVFKFTQN